MLFFKLRFGVRSAQAYDASIGTQEDRSGSVAQWAKIEKAA
jgi:hypothetical protein